MVLLQNDSFISELTKLFQSVRKSGSVNLCMKRYDGRTKPLSRDGAEIHVSEYKCLIRATLGSKKISTVVSAKELNRFQQLYSSLLKANIDGLKKRDKTKKSTTSAATTTLQPSATTALTTPIIQSSPTAATPSTSKSPAPPTQNSVGYKPKTVRSRKKGKNR